MLRSGSVRHDLETVLEGADPASGPGDAPERIALYLEPGKLPALEITDSAGVKRYRTVGLADLLKMLDKSAVLEALKQEKIRRTDIPELPPRTVFAGKAEAPGWTVYRVAGWMPPREHVIVWQDRSYTVPLPALAYSADWSEHDRSLARLYVAVAAPGVEEIHADTPLFRWPYANVYGHTHGSVCWYTMHEITLELRDVARLGVEGFLSVEDNGDLFGIGRSHNSEHTDYSEFLAAVERDGLTEEWLIPHGLTLAGWHAKGETR